MPERSPTSSSHRARFTLPGRSAGRFLVVACGRAIIALPTSLVRGILRLEDAGVTEGATTVKEIYRLTDISGRLEVPACPESCDSRIILLGRHDVHYAFRVDQVHGETEVRSQDVRPLPPHFTGAERSWFTGAFLFKDTMSLLVDLNWLLGCETPLAGATLHSQPHSDGGAVLDLELAKEGDDAPWATP